MVLRIEAASERLIEHYVATGYGIGLAVAVPGFKPAPQLSCSSVASFPIGGCRCGMVRQAFRNRAPFTGGVGHRSRDCRGRELKKEILDSGQTLSVGLGVELRSGLLAEVRLISAVED